MFIKDSNGPRFFDADVISVIEKKVLSDGLCNVTVFLKTNLEKPIFLLRNADE